MGNTDHSALHCLIFDVDGTLADTERDGHRVAFNQAFAEYGLDWHWDESLYGQLLSVHRRQGAHAPLPGKIPGPQGARR